MRDLASKFSISDRGLAKACAAADIPVPERGYWNKLQAGKKVVQRPLPPRGIGKSDVVVIGGGPRSDVYLSDDEILQMPMPPEPVFETPLEEVRQEIVKIVRGAPFSKKITQPHRLIAGLLAKDELHRQKYLASPYRSIWNAPIFDSAFEKRRLRLLNALFTGFEYCGMKPSVGGKEARDISVAVGDQRVLFSLDSVNAKKNLERERLGYSFTARDQRDRMYLSLSHWRQTDMKSATWSDGDNFSLEEQLPEIAIQILFTAEESFREWKVRQREYLIERKAELLERERRRKLENERRRLEHEAKLQQQRINHLLGQATALHRAVQIRSYVAAVTEANGTSPNPMSIVELLEWGKWALAQADRIDPIISGRFRDRPKEIEPPSDLEASDEDDY
jgi:hypothetical protein